MNKRKILVPKYYKDFICDGKTCEDNCCIGNWNIDIDKKHFMKIKSIKDKTIKPKIDKYIKRNRSFNKSDGCYGKLNLDRELGKCVFLTEDKLCEMQMKLGTDYLCNTCMIYPRNTSIIDGSFEKSLTLSCPIVAKLSLLNKEGIDFE